MDRKAYLMVKELSKYSINATGISEMKWFRQEVWDHDDNAKGKWNAIKESVLEAARDKLGFENRH